MKKIFALLVLVVASVSLAVAQPRAIGGRLAYGLEASYQHGMGENNMISVDFGFPGFWGLEAAATYDWINPFGADFSKVWEHKGMWNWYMGVGAGIGMWGWHNPVGYVGVAGRIGVEYNFWFPLQLSVDWRPIIGPNFGKNYVGFHADGLYAGGISFGVRYLFGQKK